jgi:hypothetical protein
VEALTVMNLFLRIYASQNDQAVVPSIPLQELEHCLVFANLDQLSSLFEARRIV